MTTESSGEGMGRFTGRPVKIAEPERPGKRRVRVSGLRVPRAPCADVLRTPAGSAHGRAAGPPALCMPRRLCYPSAMVRPKRRSIVVRFARAPRATAAVARRRRRMPLEQLGLDFELSTPRWSFSRLVLRSPHFDRIRERIEFVRGFF